MIIHNPILRGFHPDPSMIYVNGMYYIATSTFEWYPGVRIQASTDLKNWKVVDYPLKDGMIQMIGNPASGGIWAPCLSYDGERFYLIFTDVKTWADDPFKDTHNYITSATEIGGTWSQPVYLNSSGFDPSLFHGPDGRKWLVNMEWDYRYTGNAQFQGILLQEYDSEAQTLVGPIHKIFTGSSLGRTEGPHLYYKDGYYYLFTAEGGTSYEHAETVARSRNIQGPYELHPNTYLITAYGTSARLQKAGHASLCQGEGGNWYLAHLCGRPINESMRCVLGRETAIQEIIWDKGWPYLKNGTTTPQDYIQVQQSVCTHQSPVTEHYQFHTMEFLQEFQSLRIPLSEEIMTLKEHPGYLRLYGRESILSRHVQALLCRRQDAFSFEAETEVQMEPTSFQHMAGLIYRYNEENQYYLYLSYDETSGDKILGIMSLQNGSFTLLPEECRVHVHGDVKMKLVLNREVGQFYYSVSPEIWETIGNSFDVTILSDEYASPMGFTGAFVGMCCQDLQNHRHYADFKYFTYTRHDP